MYTRAKKILASELMYALEMNEEEVEQHIYSLLSDPLTATGSGKVAVAAK
jgi:CarD family transcriptional regulator